MARLTDQEFEAKWNLGFADNTMQDITEKTFRDFKTDLKDTYANLKALNVRQVKGATYPLPYTDSVSQIPAPYRIVGMLARAKVGTTAAEAATLPTPPKPVTLQLVADVDGDVDALIDEQPGTRVTTKAKWIAVDDGSSVLYDELGDQTDGAPTNRLLQASLKGLDTLKPFIAYSGSNPPLGFPTFEATAGQQVIQGNCAYYLASSPGLTFGQSFFGNNVHISLNELVNAGDNDEDGVDEYYPASFSTEVNTHLHSVRLLPADYYDIAQVKPLAYVTTFRAYPAGYVGLPTPADCTHFYANSLIGYQLRNNGAAGGYVLHDSVAVNGTGPGKIVIYLFGTASITGTLGSGTIVVQPPGVTMAYLGTATRSQWVVRNRTYSFAGKEYKWTGSDAELKAFDATNSNWAATGGSTGAAPTATYFTATYTVQAAGVQTLTATQIPGLAQATAVLQVGLVAADGTLDPELAEGTGFTYDATNHTLRLLAGSQASGDYFQPGTMVRIKYLTGVVVTGNSGVATPSGTVLVFTQEAEYATIFNGTFTVDTTGAKLGVAVTVRLGASATVPTLPAAFVLLFDNTSPGDKRRFSFCVAPDGTIEYYVTKLP